MSQDCILSYLSPSSEDLQGIFHEPEYIVKGTDKKRIRKIYKEVEYLPYEKQQIIEFKKFLQSQKKPVQIPQDFDDSNYLKILYGGKFKFPKSLENLQKNLEWRNDSLYHTRTKKIDDLLATGFMYLAGKDTQHRPVLVFDALKIDTKKSKDDDYKNNMMHSVCYFLDQIRAAVFVGGKVENWVFLIDTGGLGISDLPTSVLKQVIGILQVNYGGCLHKLGIMNPSTMLSFSWGIVKAFIDEDSQKKIQFYKTSQYKEIQQYVDKNKLEKRFGGNMENIQQFWPIREDFFYPIKPKIKKKEEEEQQQPVVVQEQNDDNNNNQNKNELKMQNTPETTDSIKKNFQNNPRSTTEQMDISIMNLQSERINEYPEDENIDTVYSSYRNISSNWNLGERNTINIQNQQL